MVINRGGALVAAWLCLGSATALAQQGPPPGTEARARAHFDAATQAYDTGDYELAVREFRAAYDATGHPDLLYNIYLAAERAGRLAEAEQALSTYLDEGDIPDERRPALEQRLARLQERIEAGAQGAAEQPPAAETEAPPPAAPAGAEAPAPPSKGGVSPAAVALLVTAGALAVSFGVFAGLSQKEDHDLSSTCGAHCTDDQVRALRTYNIVADVSWTTGLAAGATGLVLLFVLRDRDEPSDGKAVPTAWAGRHGGGLMLGGRF